MCINQTGAGVTDQVNTMERFYKESGCCQMLGLEYMLYDLSDLLVGSSVLMGYYLGKHILYGPDNNS